MQIRLLTPGDAVPLVALRREALESCPLSFSSSLETDRFRTVESAREHLKGNSLAWTFGAFTPELVGMVGVYRNTQLKLAHKAYVVGMYVTEVARRQGIASALLDTAISHARTLPGVLQLHLSAMSSAETARRMYETAGFSLWGTEPRSLLHQGQEADEHHYVLAFEPWSC